MKARGVGKLIIAEANAKEFIDSVDNAVLQAWLRSFPFAKAFDRIVQSCENGVFDRKTKTTVGGGISVEKLCGCKWDKKCDHEQKISFNTRRCPDCKHVHNNRQDAVFTCEVCGFKRPSDQILAWNMLQDVVGDAPIKKSEQFAKKFRAVVRKAI